MSSTIKSMDIVVTVIIAVVKEGCKLKNHD